MTTQCVQVKLELGHKATIRSKPTAEGFTHDWTVFVRGPESYNIQHFVEKVVFNLHESFPKPKRVVKEPPYQVSESGYAGFVLPIDVHFKNKEEPKKIRFDYDLFLHLEGPPVNHIRCEKLTFQNPTEDFRRKLIKSGGVGILGPDGGTVLGQQGPGGGTEDASTGEVIHSSLQPSSKSKSSPDVMRKHKSASAGKVQETKPVVPASTTSAPGVSEPFVALFGQPIKTNKPSPDSQKSKDGSGRSSGSKSSKSGSSLSGKDRVPSPSSNSKEGKTSSLKDGKPPAKENVNKTGGKRPPLPPPSLPSSAVTSDSKSTNKENKGSTMKRPPSPLTPPPSESSKEGKKRKSSSSSTKKPKDKHQPEKKSEKVKDKESQKKKETSQSSSHSKVPKEQEKEKSACESSGKTKSVDKESKVSSKKKTSSEPPPKPKLHKETSVDSVKGALDGSKTSKPAATVEQRNSNSSSLDASPDSSISFSSLQISGKRGPLGALMAELDDQDDDDELVSPLSSDPPSPPHFSSQDTPAVKLEPMEMSPRRETPKVEKPKSSKHSKSTKVTPAETENASRDKLNSSSDSSSSLPNLPVGTCESDLNKLIALQRHLMLLTDRDLVQKVVDLIEETRQYSVSSSSFDFDLCALDTETVNKIYVCLGKMDPVTT